MSEPLLSARGVAKEYKLRSERSLFASIRRRRTVQRFWALRELDFDVFPGEVLSVIGRNGAGKSTLLKLAAGVSTPTVGHVARPRRVAPLIEVGAGFHPELTGRENVIVNGRLLGLGQREIERSFDDIVGFAGLEHAIDQPIREYSSGMFMRLGFSVAVHTRPDVLVVDEVLAVGDMPFQVRCLDRIKAMRDNGAGILFVSHNEAAVLELSNRVILLDKGTVISEGEPRDVTAAYHHLISTATDRIADSGLALGDRLNVEEVAVIDGDGRAPGIWAPRDAATVQVLISAKTNCGPSVLGIRLHKEGSGIAAGWHPGAHNCNLPAIAAGTTLRVDLHLDLNLTPGTYQLEVAIANEDFTEMYAQIAELSRLAVEANSTWAGIADVNPRIAVLDTAEARASEPHDVAAPPP